MWFTCHLWFYFCCFIFFIPLLLPLLLLQWSTTFWHPSFIHFEYGSGCNCKLNYRMANEISVDDQALNQCHDGMGWYGAMHRQCIQQTFFQSQQWTNSFFTLSHLTVYYCCFLIVRSRKLFLHNAYSKLCTILKVALLIKPNRFYVNSNRYCNLFHGLWKFIILGMKSTQILSHNPFE